MKSIKFIAIFAILAVIATTAIFVGCKKENKVVNKTQKILRKSTNITEDNGILCFNSFEDILATMSELEHQNDIFYKEAIYPMIKDFSEEMMIDYLEQSEIDFEETFSKFEKDFGNFKSLRRDILDKEEKWLAETDGENIEEDPDNHYIIQTSFRTILNEYCEIRVGEVYFRFLENCHIETNDINVLLKLRHKSLTEIIEEDKDNEDYFIFLDEPKRDECQSVKYRSGYKYNTDKTRRIKWTICHRTPFPVGRFVKAKTINYYKKGKQWKKYSTYCGARVYGYVSGISGNCSDQYDFNPKNLGLFYQSNKDAKHKISVPTKTKSGWVKGYHIGAGGIVHNSVLIF